MTSYEEAAPLLSYLACCFALWLWGFTSYDVWTVSLTPRFLMNATKAWIVEVFISEGSDPRAAAEFVGRNMSRFAAWKQRKLTKQRLNHAEGLDWKCAYCSQSMLARPGAVSKDDECPQGPPRINAHWRIVRDNGDRWQHIRKRDLMTLEAATDAIRSIYSRGEHSRLFGAVRGSSFEYRLRNLKTDDIIMGSILYPDLRNMQVRLTVSTTAGVTTAFTSKNP